MSDALDSDSHTDTNDISHTGDDFRDDNTSRENTYVKHTFDKNDIQNKI
jgi:hypothetical protein